MADVLKFDVYDDKGTKVVDAQPSPVVIDKLTAATTYKGYTITYAGKATKTTLDDIITKAAANQG
ncbi:hypothetical protein [Secundilactobacillus kimchicus]|uniref:hypothetical protein n=1 Tax=Secundilactobacillus kimchicus TaxID=528209 RepID=UPI0024A9DD49|nr:hypothetical protein [Secundilactobacillus kimchicus]